MGEPPNARILDPHVLQTEGLQIDDHILSISCEVVERPDHHCSDDLVTFTTEFQGTNRSFLFRISRTVLAMSSAGQLPSLKYNSLLSALVVVFQIMRNAGFTGTIREYVDHLSSDPNNFYNTSVLKGQLAPNSNHIPIYPGASTG